MKKALLILISALLLLACKTPPSALALGTWKYRILMNGVEIGEALVSNRITDCNYVSSTEMNMKIGGVSNSVLQTVTETLDFKPVKLEITTRIRNGDKKSEMNTTALFQGGTVELASGGTKSRVTIGKPFHLEGNFVTEQLIKKKFKAGTEIQTLIYDPTIDPDEPFRAKVKVLGREKVSLKSGSLDLIHIVTQIENIKSVDSFIDDQGVMHKTVILMLNNEIVLEIK